MNVTYEEITKKGVGVLNEDAIIMHPKANLYGALDGVFRMMVWSSYDRGLHDSSRLC